MTAASTTKEESAPATISSVWVVKFSAAKGKNYYTKAYDQTQPKTLFDYGKLEEEEAARVERETVTDRSHSCQLALRCAAVLRSSRRWLCCHSSPRYALLSYTALGFAHLRCNRVV